MDYVPLSREARLRLATVDDLPRLTEIYNAAITETDATSFLEPMTVEGRQPWWDAHQDPRYPVLVAEEEGQVLGYSSLSVWTPGPVYAHTAEVSVFLSLEARGRGHGRRLLQAIIDLASERGHHHLISRVWASNAASLALCHRCGFEVVGIQRDIGRRRDQWEDCVILQRLL